MSRRRLNDAEGLNHGSEVGSVTIAPYEHPAVYEYLGKNRYLQVSFCKAVAKLYSDKFGTYTTKALANMAAEGGFIGVLEWSKEVGCSWDPSVFASGLKGGHVDILKFLKRNACPLPTGNAAWTAAAERGHVEALQFAYDSKYLHNIKLLCAVAAKNGHLSILKWIYEVEGSRHFSSYTCQQAAMGGFIDIIEWLRGVQCDWEDGACQGALETGRLDTLRWLIANGCPFDVDGHAFIWGQSKLGMATRRGEVEIMRFLLDECHANANSTAADLYPPLFNAITSNRI